MKRIILVILATAFAVVLVACSKTENTSNSNANKNSGTAPSTAPATSSNGATAASAGDKIGVPECDDYIAKYESCVRAKVPEAMRGQLESSLKTARDNWKRAAENTATRGTLAAACKQATDAAAASMKAYGCNF